MSRVTSKLQVTIPRAVADRYGIEPGDDIEFVPAGDAIRVIPGAGPAEVDTNDRLACFDAATLRQQERQQARRVRRGRGSADEKDRGWTREELYERGRTR